MTTHDDLTYPDMTPDTGSDASRQIGPAVYADGRETYGVRGIDGGRYVLTSSLRRNRWEIYRAGHYGPGAVTSGATPKAAVQHLNAFHEGETCDHCQHVNSTRGHGCDSCGRIRYGKRYAS